MNSELSTLEQRLSLLVAMPTATADGTTCQKAIESIDEELRSLGMHTTVKSGDHPHLVATTRKTKQPKIMLVAHLDVVPEDHGSHYELRIHGDNLTGRGVFDMKFAAACYLELVHNLAESGTLPIYDFGIIFTTDEEVGGQHGVAELLENGWSTELAIVPDGGENWLTESAAKGVLTLELSAPGRSAHGSRPWEGDNAITRLMDLLANLRQKFPYISQDALTLSVNQFSAGQAMNQIPDQAAAVVDIRAFTQTELHDADQYIRHTAKKYSIDVREISSGQPLALDPENELVQTTLDLLERFLGKPNEFSKSFGATDGRWFSKYGIPCFIIRPAGGGIHGPDEWVLRSDLPKFYSFLRQLTEEIALGTVDKPVHQAQTAAI